MAGLRVSLARLEAMFGQFEKRLAAAAGKRTPRPPHPSRRLREVANFGSNPGNLRMFAHVPSGANPSRPLVVALHGCTQTADAYDQGTGWSGLAERFGFAVIYPEQQRANNPKNCFSWFLPGDTTRNGGEALSIRQMIEKAALDFGVDRRRIYVTGLSAGGAMTSVMLATYPEVFAGGAIIAGLPYGCASSVQEAFEAMFTDRAPSPRALAEGVRAASRHQGPWPKISIWHGSADTVVKPSNAEHIVDQWLNVHALSDRPSVDTFGAHTRRVWADRDGEPCIECFAISGMSHGVPIATTGADSCGIAGPFFLDAGLSSSRHIIRFWGLDTAAARQQHVPIRAAIDLPDHLVHSAYDPATVVARAFKSGGLAAPETSARPGRARTIDPRSIIEAALKSAGLMRG